MCYIEYTCSNIIEVQKTKECSNTPETGIRRLHCLLQTLDTLLTGSRRLNNDRQSLQEKHKSQMFET